MLLTVLPLEESRLRLHLSVRRLNQEQPARSHTRVGADGRIKTVTTRPKVLCDGAKTTGVLLLQRARKQAIHFLASSSLPNEVLSSLDGLKLPDVPPIEVNGRELSERRGLTDRALRNHLVQLKKVGIIVKRKFRGSRASFHVWMNPELVWETHYKVATTAEVDTSNITHNSSTHTSKSKIVPHTKVLEALETSERDITAGENSAMESSVRLETRNPLHETEARNGGRALDRKKNGAGRALGTDFHKSELVSDVVRDPVQLKKIGYVLEFWEAAKVLVYPNDKWTEGEERLAKNSIWTNVFNGFHNYDNFDWPSIQVGLLHRLQLVHDHFQLHPGKYAPFPYHQYKPGTGYFDAANERGFAGTAAWLRTVNKRKQSLKVDRALRAAIKEIEQHNALTRTPEIKMVANERVRTHSLLQLIRYHERALKHLGNASALDRFYAKLANKVSKSTFKAVYPR